MGIIQTFFNTPSVSAPPSGGKFISRKSSSTNGTTWTAIDPEPPFTPGAIHYANNRWVATGGSFLSPIQYSDDGVNWTTSTMAGFMTPSAFAYGNNTWVAVGSTNKIAYSTNNGVNWTVINAPVMEVENVVFGNGRFVTFGSIGFPNQFACYSTNGINWTASSTIENTQGVSQSSMAFGNGVFVAQDNSNIVFYSTDGETWATNSTSITFEGATQNNGTLVWAGDRFVTKSQTGLAAYSFDGINWSEGGSVPGFNGIAFGAGILVAVTGSSPNSEIYTSTDRGLNWTTTILGSAASGILPYSTIAFGGA